MGSERSKSALNCHGQPKHFPPMISNSSNIWTVRASNLIHSGMFDVVENEAQLAAVADGLSRNVANAVLSESGRRSHGIPNVDRGRPGHWSRSVNRLSCLHKTQSRTDPEACSAGAQPSRALNRV